MNIKAFIPLERVQTSETSYTYREEVMDVEAVAIVRYSACLNNPELNRWHYMAYVKRPECVPDCYKDGVHDDLIRVNVIRKLNPKWKPPVFPEGENIRYV